jgi:hypothetical protein
VSRYATMKPAQLIAAVNALRLQWNPKSLPIEQRGGRYFPIGMRGLGMTRAEVVTQCEELDHQMQDHLDGQACYWLERHFAEHPASIIAAARADADAYEALLAGLPPLPTAARHAVYAFMGLGDGDLS